MNRAYSLFEIKSIEEDQRTFEGVATTPSTDRMDDIVEPMGAKFKLPIPMLWQHGKGAIKDPVGWITHAVPSETGIAIRGQMAKPKDDYPQSLRDELNGVWVKVRDKIVRGLSIGFLPMEAEPIKGTFGTRFKIWEFLELSPVGIAANVEASITSIKSLDQSQLRAVSGALQERAPVSLRKSPGASGLNSEGTAMKTTKEKIQDLENKRAANVARMNAISEERDKEGRGMTDAEGEEFDTLDEEVKSVDSDIAREKRLLALVVATAAPVSDDETTTTKTTTRTPVITMGQRNLPKGIPFTRWAMCIGKAKGNLMQAEILSRQFMDSTPEVNLAMKAAVAAGTTQDATWAAPLVQLQEMQSEFVEFLRPQTLLGNIPNLRRVPFNIKFTRQTAGTTGTFVGEGLPKPLGKMDFELLSLTWAKAATIIVMTEELVRFSNPGAEILARDDLAAGIARYLDLRFIDPVYAGVANVSPASITNGITAIASTGTTVAAITADIATALKAMAAANLNLGSLVWIMNPSVAIDLSLKRTAQDLFAFPDISATGGTFMGYPVIMSNNVALSGSPTEAFVVLLDPTNIMLADDGGVTIDMSTEASLQMDGAPTNPATSTVNLWQSNMIALRAERFINWRRRRETAVQLITMNAVW